VNPWTCVVGADMAQCVVTTGDGLWAAQRTTGAGTSAQFTGSVRVAAHQQATVTFFIAGSSTTREAALATLDRLRAEQTDLVAAKLARAQRILQTSAVRTPDERLNAAIAWSKLTNQRFLRDVPPHGAGVGAGLPEYPWWFGIDAEYAVLPMLQSGQFELVRETLQLLMRHSLATNTTEPGRVIHEMSTTGAVFNAGNLVETVAFTRAVHQYWLWTGDRRFLDEVYAFCKHGVLDYALGACDQDGDLCPSGRSIIETLEMHAGFEVIDVAAFTWDALVRLADLADVVGDGTCAEVARSKAGLLANRIRTEWWLADEGLFADVRASVAEVEQALAQLEASAAQQSHLLEGQRQVEMARQLFKPYLAKYKDQPRNDDLPWLLRHWVVFCPAEVGLATPQQTAQVLQRINSPEFWGEWGMYLHPERRDAMSINTGLLALTAARYGNTGMALRMMQPLINAFSYRTPGAISEALPDQWCFMQLWSNVGVMSPVVECMLGIEPRAAERRLRVTPNLPAGWNWVEVHGLRAGEAIFDIHVERNREGYAISVSGATGWTVEAGAILPDGVVPKSVQANAQSVPWQVVQTNAGRCLRCLVEAGCRLNIALP
jgi:glycogen debranching enzyme